MWTRVMPASRAAGSESHNRHISLSLSLSLSLPMDWHRSPESNHEDTRPSQSFPCERGAGMPNVALGLGDGPRAQFAHACMCIFNTFYITSTGTKSFSRAPVALFRQPSRWREADLELAAAVLAHTRGWLRCDSPRRARLIRACAGQPFVRTGSAVRGA